MKYTLTISLIALNLVFAFAQQKSVMTPEDMAKLIPAKIEGYRQVEKFKGRMVKVGTLSYSIVEQSFRKNKHRFTILLFDFNDASIMFRQATYKWKEQLDEETENIVQRSFLLPSGTGWEVYDKINQASKIQLGVHDRFYLILQGEGMELNALQNILELIELPKFPHNEHALMDPKHQ